LDQFIDEPQDLLIRRDVGHGITVMCVSYQPLPVNHKQSRHAPKFDQVDFLVVLVGDAGTDIRAADKGHVIHLPVTPEGIRTIRTQGDDLNPALRKFRIILAQLRQVRLAVWSGKTAQKHQHHRLAAVNRQADGLAARISQFKIGRLNIFLDLIFHNYPFKYRVII